VTRVPFCFVDVFARRPLTGNPLSLVPDADDLVELHLRSSWFRPGVSRTAPVF
jgi:predicted PhzF superfamily epimerase YddE/YHI9